MMRNRNLIFMTLLIFLVGCIKPFKPSFKDASIEKYVVHGMLSSEQGWQEVNISKTSGTDTPLYNPLSGCDVKLVDELGKEFIMHDADSGIYRGWIEQEYLVQGRGYKLIVKTPSGDHLESEYDYMPNGADIKTPNYQIESHQVEDDGPFLNGLQFYIDLEGNENQSRYYRWQLTETWEYHSRYPIEYYYDGEIQQISPPDSTEFLCWTTNQVDEIFTLNTSNYFTNGIVDFPLHFVANNTPKLGILYSLLINQIALSEEAFNYWDQLRGNQTEQGGLYYSQPMFVEGNISNVLHPDETVLGFFQVSTVSSLRVFVDPPQNIEFIYTDWCNPILFERSLSELNPNQYPFYLETIDGNPSQNIMNDECLFCTLRGGTTEKPNFWP